MLAAMPRKVCSRVASACSGPAELRPGGAVSVRRLPRRGRGCDDVLMGVGFLKALLVIAAATLAVGCGGGPRPPAHQRSHAPAHPGGPAPARQDSPAPALDKLTNVEACLQL